MAFLIDLNFFPRRGDHGRQSPGCPLDGAHRPTGSWPRKPCAPLPQAPWTPDPPAQCSALTAGGFIRPFVHLEVPVGFNCEKCRSLFRPYPALSTAPETHLVHTCSTASGLLERCCLPASATAGPAAEWSLRVTSFSEKFYHFTFKWFVVNRR